MRALSISRNFCALEAVFGQGKSNNEGYSTACVSGVYFHGPGIYLVPSMAQRRQPHSNGLFSVTSVLNGRQYGVWNGTNKCVLDSSSLQQLKLRRTRCAVLDGSSKDVKMRVLHVALKDIMAKTIGNENGVIGWRKL